AWRLSDEPSATTPTAQAVGRGSRPEYVAAEDHDNRPDVQRHSTHPDHEEAVRRVHQRTREALARGPAGGIRGARRLEPSTGPAQGAGRGSHRDERLRLR